MTLNRRAFTLFELMVVVMIIGIVYALVLGRFNPKQQFKVVTLESLRETLTQHHQDGQRLDLVLYDKCRKSALFLNGEVQEKMQINLKPALFEDLKVYKSDPFGQEREIHFPPVIIADKLQPVCFQFTVYPNGSASNYIIEKKGKFYVFPPYFEEINITGSIDEALALFTHSREKRVTSYE